MQLAARILAGSAIAALLAAPAAADWSMFGSVEPSTPYDDATWMWPTAGGPGEQKVYFNVVSASTSLVTAFSKPYVNPNVGALQTQIEPFGMEYHRAYLGVWVDCNGDKYLGMAESGLREYSASLLLDDSACPDVSGPPTGPWPSGAHNFNGWVSEFIAIQRNVLPSSDRRVYRDDEVRVWGDFHRPDERPFHRSCALNPQPRGTYQSTGGMINYVDCRFDLLGPANDAFALVGDPMGWRFADEDDARSGALGRIETLGSEDSSHTAVYLVDCDAGPSFHSGDFFNSTPLGPSIPADFQNETLPTFDPRPGNLEDPNVPGTINQSNEELLGDCDTSNDFGHDTYDWLEADFNGVNPNNKIESDWNFNSAVVGRGNLPFSALGAIGGSGPSGIPGDGGVGIGGTHHSSDSTWASKTGPRSVRADLENGGAAIAPAYWLSFYAHVGAVTKDRGFQFPGGEGIYGSWHCGDNTAGIHSGWNCDASLWYQNPDGTFPNDPNLILAKPGWTYQMRDVDCYDGRIGDSGIGIQPAFYGPEPCP